MNEFLEIGKFNCVESGVAMVRNKRPRQPEFHGVPLEVYAEEGIAELHHLKQKQSERLEHYGTLEEPGRVQPAIPKHYLSQGDPRARIRRAYGRVEQHYRTAFPAQVVASHPRYPQRTEEGQKRQAKKQRPTFHLTGIQTTDVAPSSPAPFTTSEDNTIIGMRRAGMSWPQVASKLPSRTQGAIKKHYYASLREYVEDAQTIVTATQPSG